MESEEDRASAEVMNDTSLNCFIAVELQVWKISSFMWIVDLFSILFCTVIDYIGHERRDRGRYRWTRLQYPTLNRPIWFIAAGRLCSDKSVWGGGGLTNVAMAIDSYRIFYCYWWLTIRKNNSLINNLIHQFHWQKLKKKRNCTSTARPSQNMSAMFHTCSKQFLPIN